MPDINTYLSFNGNAREALAFYAEVLGGEVTVMDVFGDMAKGMPGADPDHIMHGRLVVGDKTLMASDAPMNYAPPQGIHVQVGFEDVEGARAAFTALAEGGSIQMPFEKTFWAAGFGMCTDRFGIPWMINCDEMRGHRDEG